MATVALETLPARTPGLADKLPILNTDTGEANSVSVQALKTEFNLTQRVDIKSMADFPTPVAGVITLENKAYRIDGNLTTADRFLIPDGVAVRFEGSDAFLSSITYTGVAAMISGDDITSFSMVEVTPLFPNGSLFDITPAAPSSAGIFMESMILTNGASLGIVSNLATFSTVNVGIDDIAQGLSLNNIFSTSVHLTQYGNGQNAGGTFFSFDSGTFGSITFSVSKFAMDATEKMLNFDPAATFDQIIVNACTANDITRIFEAGSLDQKQIGASFIGNEGIPNSQKVASYFMNDNTTDTDITTAGLGNWVKVAGTTTLGQALEKFDLPITNRARFLNKQFTGNLTATISANTGSASAKTYEFAVFKNGVIVPGSITKRTITNLIGAIPLQGVFTLTTNDYIEIFARQTVGTLADVLITDMNPFISGI